MAEFPPFAFTTQESWYGEMSFKAAEDSSALSLAGRQFEMHITPAMSGAQLVPPVLVLTMDEGRGLTLKQGDPSTLVFRVPQETAISFPRGEFTADLLEVAGTDRFLFMPVRVTYAEPSGLRAFLSRFLGVSVSFAARQQPIYTPLAVPGREGRPGATILTGTVPPVPADGKDGDFFIEERGGGRSRRMYGPKKSGNWPGTPWDIQAPEKPSFTTIDLTGGGSTGDVSSMSYRPTGGSSLRPIADWANDVINIRDNGDNLASAVARLPITGGTVMVPRKPGGYELTEDVSVDRPVQFIMQPGVEFVSDAKQILIRSPRVRMDANGARLTYAGGDPAQSRNRAIRLPAQRSALRDVTAPIPIGALTMEAAAGDLSDVVVGDWLVVGNWTTYTSGPAQGLFDWESLEWLQVRAVSGTTVTFTRPVRRSFGATYAAKFHRILASREGISIRSLRLVTTDTLNDNFGIDFQYSRGVTIDDCDFEIAKGMAFQTYVQSQVTISNNRIRQYGRRSSFSSCVDGTFFNNRFGASPSGAPTDGCLSLETGSAFNTLAANTFYGGGPSALAFLQWSDFNRFVGNTYLGDVTGIGARVFGGVGNQFVGEDFTGLSEAIRLGEDTQITPIRKGDANKVLGGKARNCGTGVRVMTGNAGNEIHLFDCDATVTTKLSDAGTGTMYSYTDGTALRTRGLKFGAGADTLGAYVKPTAFTPVLLGSTTAGAHTYTQQLGRYTRIGDSVIIQVFIQGTIDPSWSGQVRIGGMPFATLNVADDGCVTIGKVNGLTMPAGFTQVMGLAQGGTSYVELLRLGAAGTANIVTTEFGSSFVIQFSVTVMLPS